MNAKQNKLLSIYIYSRLLIIIGEYIFILKINLF